MIDKPFYSEEEVMAEIINLHPSWSFGGLGFFRHIRCENQSKKSNGKLVFRRFQLAKLLRKFGNQEQKAWAATVPPDYSQGKGSSSKQYHDGRRIAGPAWDAVRKTIFVRDDFTCQYCGKRGGRLECDHVIPVAKGGSHLPENLKTACFACNRSKHDKSDTEWALAKSIASETI